MKKNKIIVIFSSHHSEEDNNKFIEHINKTIGVPRETYCYPNFNQYSLSQVYNQAINNHAKDDAITVFCHNDILFDTKDWGKKLLLHFNNPNNDYQIIGLAGSVEVPQHGCWYLKPDGSGLNMNSMIGVVNHDNGIRKWASQYSGEFKGVEPVVTVDGVFMAVDTSEIEHNFDTNYGMWHYYDMSFCIPNYLDGCNIGVITDIRITHKSIGATDQEWENNRLKFVNEYVGELPILHESLMIEVPDVDPLPNPQPRVNVIIPTKNNISYLTDCIKSFEDISRYENYKIIIADTGSDKVVLAETKFLIKKSTIDIQLVEYDYYSFSKINNDVVNNHVEDDCELILFCNDDIKLMNDALTLCASKFSSKNNIGTAGIRLHYSDDTIQHAGIYCLRDSNDNLRLSHVGLRTKNKYSGIDYKAIGNTGAFLMITKELFNEIGGFNEIYTECFEDVELNFQALINGYKNITIYDAVAYHYESVSRSKSSVKQNNERVDLVEKLIPFYENNKSELNKYIKQA